MAIKSIDTFSDAEKTATVLEIDAPDDVKEEIGDYLIEQIMASTAEQTSPVAGYGKFAALSKKYKAKKEESGRPGVPNLDYDGDMQSALDYELTDEGIEIGVYGKEAPKADGHNNFSGDSELPLRRFLPGLGESFRKDINAEVEAIITEKAMKSATDDLSEEMIDDMFDSVTSKADFYNALSELTGIDERYLLKSATLTNTTLMKKVREYDFEGYLQ